MTAARDAPGGGPLGFATIMRDMTAERMAADLRRSEALQAGLVSLASDAIVTTDAAQRTSGAAPRLGIAVEAA